MADAKFATLISCIDGRIQIPLNMWIRKNYGVDYVDTITEPGVDGLAQDPKHVERIRQKALISKEAHGSSLIIVSGHYSCAANPGTREEHEEQIRQWIDVASSWGLADLVVGAWVGEDWQVHLCRPRSDRSSQI